MRKEKERRLTDAERRRKERFEILKADLEREGFVAQEMTIDIVKANIMAIVVVLPFIIVLAVWYVWVNGNLGAELSLAGLFLLLVLSIVSVVVHELIHGAVWGYHVPSHFKAIEFGVIWSALSPYCTCAEPMKKWQYILGSAMPTLVLGLGLGLVSIYTGQNLVLYLSLLMTLGGGGDFCIILKLLRHKAQGEAVYCDHPYELGLVVFERPIQAR